MATRNVGNGGRVASSTVVMRSGRHSALVTVVEGGDLYFGVIRPDWDVERGGQGVTQWRTATAALCCYCTYNGRRYPTQPHDWETEQGDRIGMLLDLDQGSMTVWKNDEKLGVIQVEGLSGEFCWAV